MNPAGMSPGYVWKIYLMRFAIKPVTLLLITFSILVATMYTLVILIAGL
jgi:hypothetical protein